MGSAGPASAFSRGILASLPLLVGILPFGLVTGIAGLQVGLSPLEVTLMSAMVFAGAAAR